METLNSASSWNPQGGGGVRYSHGRSPPVLLRWSSDVSSGRCSLAQTGRRRYRARLQTPEPPRVCADGKRKSLHTEATAAHQAEGRTNTHLGSSTNFSTSITSSLKDFLASRLADSNCSRKSPSERAMRIPCRTHREKEQPLNRFLICGSCLAFLAFFHLPASPADRFNHHWVSYLGSLCLQPLVWLVLTMVTANDGHPSSRHDVFRCAEKQEEKDIFSNALFIFVVPVCNIFTL